jgi:CHAT domain-containing protein
LSRDAKAAVTPRSRTPVLTLNCYVVNSGLSDITQRVKSFRELVARRDDKARQSARELYELLFASARDQLSGKATWLIAPDSILWQLPFAALKPTDDKYLIEEHAIAYAPSVTALLEMMRSRAARNNGPTSLLAFGNPTIDKRTADQAMLMSGSEPKTSSQSETEVRSIERLYPSTKAKVYVGTDATEALLMQEAAKFNVIHFAVPGRLSDANPLHSYLVLSKSEGNIDDGLVETKELLKLNLTCEMMILSSSEGSRNDFGAGEAVSSLAWSLLVAGCPSTVVANWANDSPSPTDLFAEFHRSLQATQTQRSSARNAKALQRAMLKVSRLEQYKEPYFWAGYSMIGDFR